MNIPHSTVKKSYQHTFAVLFIACGALSILVCFYNYYGPASSSWSTVSTVEVGAVDPEENSTFSGPHHYKHRPITSPDEWPLLISEQWMTGIEKSEAYGIDVVPVRGTNLLELHVAGPSPEHSQNLAKWLTHAFAQSLRQSYNNRGIKPLSEPSDGYNDPSDPASRVRRPIGVSVIELLNPLLLLASGLLLLRSSARSQQST